jgi:ureidoglycolate lyase
VGDARVGISLFRSRLRQFPYTLDLVERHPDGSQAFIPMSMDPFLVIVADADMTPHAFVTAAGEGINFHRGIWHGVLTPLSGTGLFAVIDRIGDSPNLEEHYFKTPYSVTT